MKLYRYYDVQYSAGCDEWGNNIGAGRVGVYLQEFEIVKETKCGVWILTGFWFGSPEETPPKECQKFVNLTARKQFACRTIEDAKESFIARKKRQIKILSAQITRAEKALVEITKNDKELDHLVSKRWFKLNGE